MIIFLGGIFIILSTCLGAFIGNQTGHLTVGIIIGLIVGIGLYFTEILIHQRIQAKLIVVSAVGLLIGLSIANLMAIAIPASVNKVGYIPLCLNLIFGYFGILLAINKREDILGLFAISPTLKAPAENTSVPYKILDTSVIIDGRIADICETGFLEGTLLIPRFILKELQRIADSSDSLKRNRGRRGLDVLNRMQKKIDIDVKIEETDFPDIREVDAKLIRLGKLLNGKVVTNDFNLNKVAELEGVDVLNINELSEAVKPVVLPGEEMIVHIIKEGKEFSQGIGYLDDGTMVVVDNGYDYMGQKVRVVVSSVLQTTAGRMIFARTGN